MSAISHTLGILRNAKFRTQNLTTYDFASLRTYFLAGVLRTNVFVFLLIFVLYLESVLSFFDKMVDFLTSLSKYKL